ncbi:ecto-ADP-ribosyltransferase 5-like [Clinocottus analis]|uniref:ecto-ADP-ribosyltransferase 5-like n=1 Tax=Clinocottus analis TaxID=304258 RepID=UPI0035C202AD
MAMKVLWAAALLAYGASTGAAMDPRTAAVSSSSLLPLDMAPNSVDDMYDGCDEQMAEKVTMYLKNEKNADPDFKKIWDNSLGSYDERRMNPTLEREQVIALYAYTLDSKSIYQPLNRAVRTERFQYKTSFRFHALHFYLTRAVQKLNKLEGRCLKVYRRTKEPFRQDVVNTRVRLGSFTSSSMLTLEDHHLNAFGDKSCFEIETCMGADISTYSAYESEAEVLIPPYEVFTVTDMKEKSEQKDLPCDVVYTLKSTNEHVSNLNCALFPERSSVEKPKRAGS